VSRSEIMRIRLEKVEEGNLSHREDIYPALLGMFREKPLLGWGPITNKYEVASRLGDAETGRRDAHNVALEILTATGVLGALPFFLGVLLCVRAAWRARTGPWGSVPLAMVLAVLAGNMSENRMAGPLLWLVLACAAASGSSVETRPVPASRAPVARCRGHLRPSSPWS
jgi:O-antigen ligase